MKILIVGYYSKETMAWYLEKNLIKDGHNVSIFCYRSTFQKISADSLFSKALRHIPKLLPGGRLYERRMNTKLNEIVQKERFDLVIILKGETIFDSTLKKIREKSILINWFMDPIVTLDKGYIFSTIPNYHYFFVKDRFIAKRLHQIGFTNVKFLLECFDEDNYKPLKPKSEDLKRYGAQIGFVGNIYPYRLRLLKEISKFDLKVWGKITPEIKKKEIKSFYQGRPAVCEEKNIIFNSSKIVFNSHNPWEVDGANARFFEICGSGAFQITDSTLLSSELFVPDKEIVTYTDINELKKKVKYYLENPIKRKAIAKAGYKKAVANHTYSKRIKQLFDMIKIQ